MKQLSREQLESLVCKTTAEVCNTNKDDIIQKICSSFKGDNNCSAIFTNAMIAYGVEIIKQFELILTKTLYDILYDGEE